MRARVATLALAFGLAACSSERLIPSNGGVAMGDSLTSSVAPRDKVRVFIGQDVTSIEAYAASVGEPAGVVGYTSLARLEGLTSPADDGGGVMHLDRLHGDFPRAPIAVGLYLVGALDDVNVGALDANIDRLAEHLDGYGVPVLLRIGYEFDMSWTGYDPAAYRGAFRRIATRIRALSRRVEFAWQSGAPCDAGDAPVAWYPGDDVLDWVALSFFRQSQCRWTSVERIAALARNHGKPVLIAEATPQGYDLTDLTYSLDGAGRVARTPSEIWNDWFAAYFGFIDGNADVVRAATYIDADWDSQGLWKPPFTNGYYGDTRVQANAQILARWNGELARARVVGP